jgi:hypothetical protein
MKCYFKLEPKVKKGDSFALPKGLSSTPSGRKFAESLSGATRIPITLELMERSNKTSSWDPVTMMSLKMADIIQEHLTGTEGIEWITAQVVCLDMEREYKVPRFTRQLDVLDTSKTSYSSSLGVVVNPWYSLDKCVNLVFFHGTPENWEITSSLVVEEPIMKAIKKAKLSGVAFSPARSS